MLNLDAAVEVRGITAYRDFNDPGLYWYMPGTPRIAREGGEPLFQLLLYRRDVTDNLDLIDGAPRGGGFLTMTVDLGVSSATLDAVASELAGVAGRSVRLAPVPFEKGAVRVTALGVAGGPATGFESTGADEDASPQPGPGFVERVLGFASPSLYQANRAVVAMELSAEGAQLMRASLEDDGASAIAILYELEFTGLLPAREVTIEIDYRQSYDHYRNRIASNTLWFKADIDAETERLRQEGSIKIEDVNYLTLEPAELAERQQALDQLAKELAQWTFFKPALSPGKVLAVERGSVDVYDPTSDATAQTGGFTGPLDSLEGGRNRSGDGPVVNPATTTRSGGVRADGGAGTGTGTPAGGQTGTGTGTGTPAGGQTGTGTSPTSESGTGGTGGASGAPDPDSAVARWNRAGRPQAGYLLRSLDQDESQHIEYSMKQVSAHRRTVAPQGSIRLLAGDSDLSGRIKEVDLADPFFERLSGTITTSAELTAAGVSTLVVAVRYGVRPDGSTPKDTAEFVLRAQGESHDFEFFLDHLLHQEIEYRVTAHYIDDFAIGADPASAQGPWVRTTTRNLDIDPRAVGEQLAVRVVAGQVDWDTVEQIQAEVSYRDAANDIDSSRIVAIGQDTPEATVPIRLADPSATTYRVASTFFYETSNETVEQVVSNRAEVVANQPPSRIVPVSVSAQDPLERLARVTVDLHYQPDGGIEQRKLLTLTGGETQTWSFVRADVGAPPSYRHRTTLFSRAGTTEQADWVETTERQLIVGDVFPGVVEVEVQTIGSMAASGVALARLVVDYPGAPPGVDSRLEVALRDPAPLVRWRVPSVTREPVPYEWQVQWVRAAADIVTESGTSSDELLFIFVPEPQ